MKVVIQRVSEASVSVNQSTVGQIGHGLMVLVGYEEEDTDKDVAWMTQKVVNLRLFSDEEGLMNLSIKDIGGELLCISQFTLHALTKKGNRPSFIKAAKPAIAIPLYKKTIELFEELLLKKIETGIFGEHMNVQLTNDGPVTIIIDSKHKN